MRCEREVFTMSFEPFLRAAGDGTFELLVPSADGAVHVLPYCFHSEEDAGNWLTSRKGREQIRKICRRAQRPPLLAAHAGGAVLEIAR